MVTDICRSGDREYRARRLHLADSYERSKCYVRATLSISQTVPGSNITTRLNAVDTQDKLKIIEDVLGFLFDEPFMEVASNFPSPEDVIEDWYLTATIFLNVRDAQMIPDEHRETLHLLIGDAVAEYKAAAMLGEKPDTKEELGVGYDGYDVPEDFAGKHQTAIWKEVLAVLGSDERELEMKIEPE